MIQGLISAERARFHKQLLDELIFTNSEGVPNFADNGQLFSRDVSKHIYQEIGGKLNTGRLSGQTLGNQFEALTKEYLRATFLKMGHLRPGKWTIEQVRSRSSDTIARFEQYTHLIDLRTLAK